MLLESPNLRADSVLDSLGPCIMGQRGGYENRSQRAWDCPPPPVLSVYIIEGGSQEKDSLASSPSMGSAEPCSRN